MFRKTKVGTLAVDWWAVTVGTARRGLPDWTGPQPAQAPPLCTKCNSGWAHLSKASVQITVFLYNSSLLCGFNVPVKGINLDWNVLNLCLLGCRPGTPPGSLWRSPDSYSVRGKGWIKGQNDGREGTLGGYGRPWILCRFGVRSTRWHAADHDPGELWWCVPPPTPLVLPPHPRLLLVNQMMHVHGVLAGNRRLNVHVSAEETTRPQVDRDVYRLFDKCN